MMISKTKNRDLLNLFLVVIITIIFTLFSLSIDFIDRIHKFFSAYTALPISEFFINAVFLWLVVTLWITYQRWVEAIKRQKELEDIISSINPDVLVVIDRDRNIIMCNASVKRLFGYDVNEVINRKFDLLYSDSYSDSSTRNEITDRLERDGFYIGLATGKKKNGDKIPLEIIADNLSDHNGEVVLLRDITERKRTEEALQKAHDELEHQVEERTAELVKANERLELQIVERKLAEEVLRNKMEDLKKTQSYLLQSEKMFAIGQLAAGVAHEIKNPINGIINYAQLLIDQSNGPDEKVEIPYRIIKEGKYVASIVKNLLSFAREQKEEHRLVIVCDIITDTLSLIKKQLHKDGIKLKVDVPTDLPKIKARRQQLQQAFTNIISNAQYALNRKFPGSHEDKILEIRSKTIKIKDRNLVRTTFYDRGIGIPANILNKICNPLFSTKPRGESTGLGLSISHGIIKDHGGRLWFDSVGGKYTKVIVDLPVDYAWKSDEKFLQEIYPSNSNTGGL